jgi:tetratricopeptide (TPR) repeat protein
MGDPEKSIEYYRASLEINPDNSYAYNNIGLYNYEKGNHFEALENLEKAIKINPKLLVAYSLKVKSLASLGLYKEAEIVFKEALKLGFDNGAVLKDELENIKSVNPKLFWDAKKFSELVKTLNLDQNTIENLIRAQRNPKEFYTLNSNLFENIVLTAFEIKNALSWYLLIGDLNRKQRVLIIDFYSSDPSKILGDVKNLLDANELPVRGTLDEFENELMFLDAEEILISIASKLKISNAIELLNIWTSEHILNIYPMEEAKWKSLNYPFINTDNGFGRIYPLATKETIEEFLTRE